jgi:hypothetical protein
MRLSANAYGSVCNGDGSRIPFSPPLSSLSSDAADEMLLQRHRKVGDTRLCSYPCCEKPQLTKETRARFHCLTCVPPAPTRPSKRNVYLPKPVTLAALQGHLYKLYARELGVTYFDEDVRRKRDPRRNAVASPRVPTTAERSGADLWPTFATHPTFLERSDPHPYARRP